MNEQRHTPGPWRTDMGGAWVRGLRIREEDAEGNIKGTAPVVARVETGNHLPDSEIRANAHLIAAAPDLLHAARLIVEGYDEWIDSRGSLPSENTIGLARAAIAKAEGRGQA